MQGYYFEPYIVPFIIGVLFLFARIWTRFFSWISVLPKAERKMMFRNIVSIRTFRGLKEAFFEILLHLRTFYINKKLWYIHLSLAFGWFLMIAVSKVNTALYLQSPINPPYIEIFFNRYFPLYHNVFYDNVMDFLLVFVLSGFLMVVFKRQKPQSFGLSVSVKRGFFDKLASRSLWAIFPLRLIAESLHCGIFGGAGFLTGNLGDLLNYLLSFNVLIVLNDVAWWMYSIFSAIFMISIPFSRYLHIFAEIPFLFLRNFGVKAHEKPTTFTFLESAACSRCGLCNEVCPIIKSEVTVKGAPMTMIRNVREKRRISEVIDTCLMCGKCDDICPVRVEHTTIRLGERYTFRYNYAKCDMSYLSDKCDVEGQKGVKVGYFAGCTTQQDLYLLSAMTSIFKYYEKKYVFIDKNTRICCGDSLKNIGNIDAAEELASKLDRYILSSGVELLVVNCPSCYRVLIRREALKGKVRVQFYTDYINDKFKGKVSLNSEHKYALYEPCAVRKGEINSESSYELIAKFGQIVKPECQSDCCGGSHSANALSYFDRQKISDFELVKFDKDVVNELITICPSCKRQLNDRDVRVRDVAELVSGSLQEINN